MHRLISNVAFATGLGVLLIVSACSERAPETVGVSRSESETKTINNDASIADHTPTPEIPKTNIESTSVSATLVITPTVFSTKLPLPSATPTETPPVTPVVVPTVAGMIEPSATPTETPPVTPVVVPTVAGTIEPSATPTETPPVTPVVVPTVAGTIEPSPTPTVIPVVVPTVAGTIEPSPTPNLAPTATLIPVPDDRFGVVAVGDIPYQTAELGVTWYNDFTPVTSPVPEGLNKLSYIDVKQSSSLVTPDKIALWAANAPGSVWVIGGEVNVNFIEPAAYVSVFDYYYHHIKTADPTARISGPSILNWEFTCTGCGGYQSGRSWFTEFIDEYSAAHDGESPPADIWAIDVYPLTWDSLPTTDWNIVVNQIQGFRTYLSTEVPGHATTPIYINEIASHWGFSSLVFIDGKTSIPAGWSYVDDFLWSEMEQYMVSIFDWLKLFGPSLNIERWFLYATHVDISKSVVNGYAGIELFDGYFAGANLNRLGLLYRDYATGVR